MKYTVKYKIGDQVWAMIDNRAAEREIVAVEIRHSKNQKGDVGPPRVTYYVRTAVLGASGVVKNSPVPEDLAADTKEQLLSQL